jgi:hypothetical protein
MEVVSALQGSPVCPQCGAATGVSIGRCIHCGFLFTEATPPVSARVGAVIGRMRPRPRPPKSGTTPVLILVGGLVTVGVISAIAWTSLQRSAEERRAASLARPPAASAPAPAASSAALEPNSLSAKAKSQALAWHRDALLVEIEATPVGGDGKIESSGSIRFAFGKPAGAKVGSGAEVLPAQFRVEFDAGGAHASEQTQARVKAVAEPNCLVEDVVKAVSSAAPGSGPLRLRYSMSEKLGRAVWRAYTAGSNDVLRTLDGVSCNILTEK